MRLQRRVQEEDNIWHKEEVMALQGCAWRWPWGEWQWQDMPGHHMVNHTLSSVIKVEGRMFRATILIRVDPLLI